MEPTLLHREGAAARPAGGGRGPALPGWASALLYLAGYVVVLVVGQSVLVLPLLGVKAARGVPLLGPNARPEALLSPEGVGLPLWSLLFGAMSWGILLLTAAYTALAAPRLEACTLVELGLRLRPTLWRDLLAGLALAGLLFASIVGAGAAAGWYAVDPPEGLLHAASVATVGFLILLPAAAAEEIAMRGYLFRALGRSWGVAGAVVATSLLFAAFHAGNPGFFRYPLAAAGIALSGFYLAAARLVTGNLWLAIFLHTGWNLMEAPVFGLPVSGIEPYASILRTRASGPELWTGGEFGPEAGLLCVLLTPVHLALLLALRTPIRRWLSVDAPEPHGGRAEG